MAGHTDEEKPLAYHISSVFHIHIWTSNKTLRVGLLRDNGNSDAIFNFPTKVCVVSLKVASNVLRKHRAIHIATPCAHLGALY